jgi:hypothetical protein
MRNAIARLGGIQVASGKRDTVVIMTGRGPTSHATLFRTPPPPPPPLKAEWQGGSGIHLGAVDHRWVNLNHLRVACPIPDPPPPPIKGRMARGLRNASSAVDLDGWTLAVQICSPAYPKA